MNRRVAIRSWMLERGITQKQVAQKAGLTQPMVSMTIKGEYQNKKVIRALMDLGCPDGCFADKQRNNNGTAVEA